LGGREGGERKRKNGVAAYVKKKGKKGKGNEERKIHGTGVRECK